MLLLDLIFFSWKLKRIQRFKIQQQFQYSTPIPILLIWHDSCLKWKKDYVKNKSSKVSTYLLVSFRLFLCIGTHWFQKKATTRSSTANPNHKPSKAPREKENPYLPRLGLTFLHCPSLVQKTTYILYIPRYVQIRYSYDSRFVFEKVIST